MASRCLVFLLLLCCQFFTRTSWAAAVVVVTASAHTSNTYDHLSSSSWSGEGRRRGEDKEEDEDVSSIYDRSAQIIREQDAEEGVVWQEETAWSSTAAEATDNNHYSLCEKPPPPENGYLKGDNLDDGGVVRIFCEVGYTLQGPDKVTCVHEPSYPGTWGIWLPKDEYRCLSTKSNVVEVRTLNGNHIEEGHSYNIYNSVKHGDDTDKNDKKKGWQYKSAFSAENVQCPKPADLQHGRLEGTDYSLYATVHITCDEGYSLIGPNHITCRPVLDSHHMAGMWEPPPLPSCHAPPPSTLPLNLIQELGKASEVHRHPNSEHTHTDNQQDAAKVEGLQTLCSLPKVVGPCRAIIPRFYFDTDVMECRPFNYGGCRGNDNNFRTFSACKSVCR